MNKLLWNYVWWQEAKHLYGKAITDGHLIRHASYALFSTSKETI